MSQFILVIMPDTSDRIAARLDARLEQSLDYFYPLKDRELTGKKNKRLKIVIRRHYPADAVSTDLYTLKQNLVL